MPVVLDTTIGGYSSGDGNVGHTLGSPSVANNPTRLAVAVVMSDEIGSGHAFTIGGQSMSALRATTRAGVAVHSFYLLNPPSGTPSVVYSCTSAWFATRTRVWFLYSAKQVAPSYGEATGASSVPTITLPANSAADYLCMGEAENSAAGVTPSGWTERVNAYAGLACDRAGPASGSVNFTTSMAQWAVQCVVVPGDLSLAVSMSGSITPTGAITRAVSKVLAGSITPSGVISRAVSKVLAGSITPSGVISVLLSLLASMGRALFGHPLIGDVEIDPAPTGTVHLIGPTGDAQIEEF